jgi:tRNA threonylcarbamoyl adenosine modification protein YeaZ
MLGEYTVNYKKTHSQTLLPMLDEVARMIELDLSSLDAIAIAGGPGSFTGLRIGSATAKGLGLALNKPIINVPTVDALAYNLVGHKSVVCPLMDARRNQTYTGLYRFLTVHGEGDKALECHSTMEVIKAQCAVGIDEIVDAINKLGEPVIFLGDGVPVFAEYIAGHCEVAYEFAPAHLNKQRAGAVAALGMEYYKEGRVESADEHAPEYLRLSQAERERKEKDSEEPL